jgi:hypothetical protein
MAQRQLYLLVNETDMVVRNEHVPDGNILGSCEGVPEVWKKTGSYRFKAPLLYE